MWFCFPSLVLIEPNKAVVNKKQTPDKGPVMLLYELFNDVQIDCVSSDGVQHSRFKMVATVNSQKFEGTGKVGTFYVGNQTELS